MLRSYLPAVVRQEFLQRSGAPPEQAFELTVLALIVMNGDRISDGECSAYVLSCTCGRIAGHPTF